MKTYNRTSCGLILSVIILVINKSDSRFAVVQFCQSFVSLSLIFKRKKKDLRSCCRDQRSLSFYYSHTGTPLLVEQSTRVEMKYEQVKIIKEGFRKLLVCKRFDYWSTVVWTIIYWNEMTDRWIFMGLKDSTHLLKECKTRKFMTSEVG